MEQLAEQYQTLYRHMAEQSKFLAKVQEPLFREPEVEETGDAANSEEPGLPPAITRCVRPAQAAGLIVWLN